MFDEVDRLRWINLEDAVASQCASVSAVYPSMHDDATRSGCWKNDARIRVIPRISRYTSAKKLAHVQRSYSYQFTYQVGLQSNFNSVFSYTATAATYCQVNDTVL
jgi:hypothetical protein